MKRIFTFLAISICVAFFLNTHVFAAINSYSWYCNRNTEHLQPSIDKNIGFIENYNGYYVDKKHSNINDGEKVIYLTFDAGYENGNIAKILDILKEEKVTAAFFILSNLVIKNPDLVIRMTNEGHFVCNHTSKHKDVTKFLDIDSFKEELEKLERVYSEATGEKLKKYFRPPEGRFSEQSMQFASELGYKTIFWSFAYEDWDNSNQLSAEKAKEKIFANLHNGEIILFHPTSDTNVEILGEVIRELKSAGYRFADLDELTR